MFLLPAHAKLAQCCFCLFDRIPSLLCCATNDRMEQTQFVPKCSKDGLEDRGIRADRSVFCF